MESSDYSHLYHDSHFNTGVLEAREHLKAREVNAREQRLLHRQDRQLQQARETCRRRHSWQQDSVRRDLSAILERTPTFDRSLKDEQRRRSIGHGQSLTVRAFAGQADVSPSCAVTSPFQGSVAPTLTPLSPPGAFVPKRTKRHLSPIASAGKTQEVWKNDTNKSPERRKPTDRRGNLSVQFSESGTSTVRLGQTGDNGQAAGHRVRGAETERAFQQTASRASGHRHSVSGPLPDLWLSSATDALSLEQRKGARLRRRGHHALMALVKVKARHDQRRLKAEVSEGSGSRQDDEVLEDPSPASTLSWLSVPISVPGVAEASGQSPRDWRAKPAPRPRFYSVD